jgi:hypothetical protein
MSGIARIGADRSAMFLHLMPLFTMALGMVLIFAGLLLVNRCMPAQVAPDAGLAADADSRVPDDRPG